MQSPSWEKGKVQGCHVTNDFFFFGHSSTVINWLKEVSRSDSGQDIDSLRSCQAWLHKECWLRWAGRQGPSTRQKKVSTPMLRILRFPLRSSLSGLLHVLGEEWFSIGMLCELHCWCTMSSLHFCTRFCFVWLNVPGLCKCIYALRSDSESEGLNLMTSI